MASNKKRGAVDIRQEKQKEVLVEELGRRPIVQGACQKLGVGRASYYRWRKEDPAFAAAVDEAIEAGVGIMNDMAESQLMKAVRDGNLAAATFWLKHRHKSYATRVEMSVPERRDAIDLSDEQKAAISESLAAFSGRPDGEDGMVGGMALPEGHGHATPK